MKKRGIASPNIADALGITEYFYGMSARIFKKKEVRRDKKVINSSYIHMKSKRPIGCDDWQTI